MRVYTELGSVVETSAAAHKFCLTKDPTRSGGMTLVNQQARGGAGSMMALAYRSKRYSIYIIIILGLHLYISLNAFLCILHIY